MHVLGLGRGMMICGDASGALMVSESVMMPEVMSFLSPNEAAICNIWFDKKSIHKQTWQHPKSKTWHCINNHYAQQRSVRDASMLLR
jgi:hypothetical protein